MSARAQLVVKSARTDSNPNRHLKLVLDFLSSADDKLNKQQTCAASATLNSIARSCTIIICSFVYRSSNLICSLALLAVWTHFCCSLMMVLALLLLFFRLLFCGKCWNTKADCSARAKARKSSSSLANTQVSQSFVFTQSQAASFRFASSSRLCVLALAGKAPLAACSNYMHCFLSNTHSTAGYVFFMSQAKHIVAAMESM